MRISRIRRAVTALAWIVGILLCVPVSPARAQEERTIHIYTWADYFDSEVVNDFQKKYGCRVVLDVFTSNETMLKAFQLDSTGYDVITASSYMTAAMRRDGMLLDLDPALLPNRKNIDPKALALAVDAKMAYSVPYTRIIAGIGYNRKQVPDSAIGTWGIFADPGLANRMALLDDMRECLGAALKALGHSLNSVDAGEVAAAGKLVQAWRKCATIVDVDDIKQSLIGGKFLVANTYNGDMLLANLENPDLRFFVPREGAPLDFDNMVISGDSPYPDLAHAFINHMLDPEIAARNMKSIRYYMPNPAAIALLDKDLRDDPAFSIPEEIISRCEIIRDLGPDTAKYVKVWDALKAEK